MNWPVAIWQEFLRAQRLNVKAWRINPLRLDSDRMQDRPLRTGLLLGLPLFFVGFAVVLANAGRAFGWVVMTICAILANLVWFGYAAYARSKEQPPT